MHQQHKKPEQSELRTKAPKMPNYRRAWCRNQGAIDSDAQETTRANGKGGDDKVKREAGEMSEKRSLEAYLRGRTVYSCVLKG